MKKILCSGRGFSILALMAKKILVIRFSSLGDVVLTEPVFRMLKESYPDSKIGFVTKKEYADVFDVHPLIDRIFILEDDFEALVREVKRFEPELIVDLHKNVCSTRLTKKFSKAKKIVYSKERLARFSKVLTKFRQPVAHTAERYLKAINGSAHLMPPELKSASFAATERQVKPSGFTIGFGLGAKWETKRWPGEHFVGLAGHLKEKYPVSRFVLFGSEEEYELGMSFKERHFGKEPVVFVFGQSLSVAKRCLARLDLLVSNDSGLMHLGAALGVPTLGLFGPTHPVLGFAPLGEKSKALSLDLYCSPCSLHGKMPCFRSRRFCLEDLRPEKVLEEAGLILDSAEPRLISEPRPTVFLDRDGTIIKERDFDYTPENIEILPGVPEALKKLKEAGYKIIVVSNQSGVGRGFFPIEMVENVHREINEKLIKQGAEIDRFYFCPHWPEGKIEMYRKECFCRKPQAGMLELADLEVGVNFSRSFLIGDRLSDLELGRAKSLHSLLVLTGQGREAHQKLKQKLNESDTIVRENILEGAEYIVGQMK